MKKKIRITEQDIASAETNHCPIAVAIQRESDNKYGKNVHSVWVIRDLTGKLNYSFDLLSLNVSIEATNFALMCQRVAFDSTKLSSIIEKNKVVPFEFEVEI